LLFLSMFSNFSMLNQLMMQCAPDLTQIVKSFINPTLCHLMNNFNDSFELLKLLNINLHLFKLVVKIFFLHLVPTFIHNELYFVYFVPILNQNVLFLEAIICQQFEGLCFPLHKKKAIINQIFFYKIRLYWNINWNLKFWKSMITFRTPPLSMLLMILTLLDA